MGSHQMVRDESLISQKSFFFHQTLLPHLGFQCAPTKDLSMFHPLGFSILDSQSFSGRKIGAGPIQISPDLFHALVPVVPASSTPTCLRGGKVTPFKGEKSVQKP